MDTERRPTPEEMLTRAEAEARGSQRGRLKIFFGAAPGVGKTYALLEAAQTRKREGADVVIGWLETHKRAETERLAVGLERLAARAVDYRGVELFEFDLDAALERRPSLLVLDELAHTNAAGSRHARRWQDAEELLAAGIDVYSTLNVQHVDSLNDVVARITGVTVRETVPDSVFDRADEIELVDLPPDDLLLRLRQGKVYLPAQAERAAENFFRKGNLIALRELALRRAAERVDAQAAEWKREQGISEPWSVAERLLVVIDHSPRSGDVVRAAYRMAARLRSPWIAVWVETPVFQSLATAQRESVDANLELAERLGAESLVVRGERLVDEIAAVVRERSITRVVVGKAERRRWPPWRPSRIDELIAACGAAEVLVTSGIAAEAQDTQRASPRAPDGVQHYLTAAAAVVAAAVICWATRDWLTDADQAMIFILAVLLVATRTQRGPSLFAAILSVAVFDFFFVPPFLTFHVADLRYVLTFAVMLVVGLTVSTFTVRLREQAQAARQRERRTATLYAMSRRFVIETGVGEIAATATAAVSELLETEAIVLLADRNGALQPAGGGGGSSATSERELAVARWVFANGRLAGHGTDTLPASEWLFVPMVGTAGHLGVFGIALGRRPAPPTPSQWQILETFVAQTALALERALLVQRASSAQIAVETERTRNELLSAVSHDVRTPLSTIKGAADALLDEEVELGAANRRELLATVREEAERLERLIADLLELTRLESGALAAQREWYPLEDVIESVLDRLEPCLSGRPVLRSLPEEVLLVPIDPVLFEQVLFNLLENSAKYGAPGTPIEIRASAQDGEALIEVADRGPGLAAGDEERVFEKFYRAADGARAQGTGLGLTVARAILKVHGGSIEAHGREEGGSIFRVRLPLDVSQPGRAPQPRGAPQ
jgi:two-component system, OmpR family, sensor histidine kinase KdpD